MCVFIYLVGQSVYIFHIMYPCYIQNVFGLKNKLIIMDLTCKYHDHEEAICKVKNVLLCAKNIFLFFCWNFILTHYISLYRGWKFNIWGLSSESECEWIAELQLHNRPMAALHLHLQVKPGVVPLPAEVLPGSGAQPLQVWH